jgi:hypothetical protein
VAAHIVAGLGFVLLPVGLFALFMFLRDTDVERLTAQGLIASWIGIGLIVPTAFGTEPFALRAIGQAAVQRNNMDLLALVMSIRTGPQARFLFPGLLVLAFGGGLIAAGVWRSGRLPRWSGVLFGLGLALFFPLFPRGVRIADGLLIGVGGVWMAWSMLAGTGATVRGSASTEADRSGGFGRAYGLTGRAPSTGVEGNEARAGGTLRTGSGGAGGVPSEARVSGSR